MVKKFKFYIDGDVHFQCDLKSMQCTGHSRNGSRCKRRCVVGFEFCYQHMLTELHLRILTSTIPNSGKGLFAMDKTAGNNDIIFRKDDLICVYNGQLINGAELNKRYGDYTAPYAVRINNDCAVDSACKRGVGSIANNNPNNNNARLSVNPTLRRVSLRATKNIKNNTEIFLSYGNTYQIHEEGVHHTTK